MALSLALALLLQASSGTTSAPSPAPVSARAGAWTTPPSRDTTGYWQQRADYTVVATLDEARQVLRARGTLRYVNRSPDTLRELYVHQYLNAFRPGSKWSALDEREGRTRFQRLGDPDFGYERFTAPPTVNGTTVRVEYPGAPDSTVARLVLPRPLRPSDSVDVVLAWEARPSTTLRRQGRRGRSYDFAHWYPKVAVYDRGGWQPNALQPAGEFYGEFGTFDVTLVVPVDQVIAATGVPVSGDPGWRNAAVGDRAPRAAADAYDVPAAGGVEVPSSRMKAVRWLARDVHGFGISLSPDYRYEGGIYVRAPGGRTPGIRSWDTVSVHVLYRPGDEKEWGGGQVVERTRFTLGWLESVYGTYAYPQMTVLHRLESGGTEFPMMQMNGSPSQGLNLHEGGHIYTYGILANNEWRSGWMDEGLTSYQTAWAQGLTIPERVRAGGVTEPPRIPEGYRAIAPTWTRADSLGFEQNRLAITGRSQPVGLRADAFRDFSTYNAMIYSRAEYMYGALRDAIGDTAFRAFLLSLIHI